LFTAAQMTVASRTGMRDAGGVRCDVRATGQDCAGSLSCRGMTDYAVGSGTIHTDSIQQLNGRIEVARRATLTITITLSANPHGVEIRRSSTIGTHPTMAQYKVTGTGVHTVKMVDVYPGQGWLLDARSLGGYGRGSVRRHVHGADRHAGGGAAGRGSGLPSGCPGRA
jgi:hypothetical protein